MLQNVVSDIMLQKIKQSRKFLGMNDLVYVYENTMGTSALRELVAEIFEFLCGRQLDWESLNTDNDEVIVKELETLAKTRRPANKRDAIFDSMPLRDWHCKWHVHEDGVRCPKDHLV